MKPRSVGSSAMASFKLSADGSIRERLKGEYTYSVEWPFFRTSRIGLGWIDDGLTWLMVGWIGESV